MDELYMNSYIYICVCEYVYVCVYIYKHVSRCECGCTCLYILYDNEITSLIDIYFLRISFTPSNFLDTLSDILESVHAYL
jgi:hypothetical protein